MKLVLTPIDNWVCLRGQTNNSFVSLLKSTVRPISFRKFDVTENCWMVYWTKLREVIDLSRTFYDVIDWSMLPDNWQIFIAGGRIDGNTSVRADATTSVLSDYYRMLYVVDNAPMEVVKACYNALVLMYHPDHNAGAGDTERFQEVVEAYRKILNHRKLDS